MKILDVTGIVPDLIKDSLIILILEEHTLKVLDAFCNLGVMVTARVHQKHGTIARTISAAESSVNYCHS